VENDLGLRRLCILYIHGLDRRWVTTEDAPRLSALMERYPHVVVDTLPTNELVSTLITGAPPYEHGLWQATLRESVEDNVVNRWLDRLPDAVTTTWQCLRYRFDKRYEVPALQRWRRRRLEFHRFKYTRWMHGGDDIKGVGGLPTIFDSLGDDCRFYFGKDFTQTRAMLGELPGDKPVDFFQSYAFDLFQHFNLDQRDTVRTWLRELDGWIGETAERCERAGVPLLLLADHGQARVEHYLDLKQALRALGLPRSAMTFYIEAQCARFWFHSDEARQKVKALLATLPRTRLLERAEMAEFGMHFDDDRYGECFLYTDHGTLFYPHDFYQPLANMFMAWKEREVMGRRMWDGRQKGYHGHLPVDPAEEGFLLLTDTGARPARERVELTDFAPTVLALAGLDAAPHMRGQPAFVW